MKNDIHQIEFVPGTDINDAQFHGTDGIDYVCINNGYSNINHDDVAPVYVVFDFTTNNHILKFVTTADSFTPQSCQDMFYGFTNLQTITGLEYLETADVASMENMFRDCSCLTGLDLSHFYTNNVTTLRYMFSGCSSLTSLDMSSFYISAANMSYMFAGCRNLHTLNLGANMNFTRGSYYHWCENLGVAAGDEAGTVWTTFFCTESQWNDIQQLLPKAYLDAGRYAWYIKAPTSVTITGELNRIGLEWKVKLNATVYPDDCTIKDVVWTSSNTAIATVDNTGNVTGKSAGTAIIYATTAVGNITGSYVINVTSTMGKAEVDGAYYNMLMIMYTLSFSRPSEENFFTSGDCTWVQLWDGGPKFATFNLGSKKYTYKNGTNTRDYLGGLYSYGHVDYDYRDYQQHLWRGYEDPDAYDDYDQVAAMPDMATSAWGSNWRLPTYDEIHDMHDNCSFTYYDGINNHFEDSEIAGFKVSGKGTYEDNYIFIPETGFFSFYSPYGELGGEPTLHTGGSYYWTKFSVSPSGSLRNAFYLDQGLRIDNLSTECQWGHAVRPVLAE